MHTEKCEGIYYISNERMDELFPKGAESRSISLRLTDRAARIAIHVAAAIMVGGTFMHKRHKVVEIAPLWNPADTVLALLNAMPSCKYVAIGLDVGELTKENAEKARSAWEKVLGRHSMGFLGFRTKPSELELRRGDAFEYAQTVIGMDSVYVNNLICEADNAIQGCVREVDGETEIDEGLLYQSVITENRARQKLEDYFNEDPTALVMIKDAASYIIKPNEKGVSDSDFSDLVKAYAERAPILIYESWHPVSCGSTHTSLARRAAQIQEGLSNTAHQLYYAVVSEVGTPNVLMFKEYEGADMAGWLEDTKANFPKSRLGTPQRSLEGLLALASPIDQYPFIPKGLPKRLRPTRAIPETVIWNEESS